ncbi:MAG: DoxX family protein [Bacteroidota bacterium]|nr:DoxX family protein [Bacteroidota bacterium]
MQKLFSLSPLWQNSGLALIKIIVGLFMVYHGWEVFDAEKMKEYTTWDSFKGFSSPSFMVYMGKSAELVGGIMLSIGFLTRLASLILAGTMLYVSVFVGNGKIWYEDQHSFLFVLLALVFFFTGPGRYSVDQLLSGKNNKEV